MPHDTDIDLDLTDPAAALSGLDFAFAVDQTGEKHSSGVYFQDIPVDPLTSMAVWDHKEAQRRGYFKLDFIRAHMYDGVRDEAHLVDLMTREPPWERFLDPETVSKLAHIRKHFDAVQLIEPRSVEELAVCLVIFRPGNRYLMRRPRFEIMRDIWKPKDEFTFKRSHALAYSTAIIVQLNLLVENEMKNATTNQNHASSG